MLRPGAPLWPPSLRDDADDAPALALLAAVATLARRDATRGSASASAWLDDLASARPSGRWRVPPPGRAAGD